MSPKFERDDVDEVRERANIVEVVGDHVRLRKAGRDFKGLCPFHQEKTPSFVVNPEKQLYFCHGCNAGGSVFTFLEQVEGLDLPALAKDGSSGVRELSRGVYETDRARNAGFDAMREVYGETDQAFSAALRGVTRAFKALLRDGQAAGGARRPVRVPRSRPSNRWKASSRLARCTTYAVTAARQTSIQSSTRCSCMGWWHGLSPSQWNRCGTIR